MQNTAAFTDVISNTRKPILVGLIGNVLDHYDTALYGFLAPFIAPLIFPDSSRIAALIMTYGLMSTSLFTRPLGALFFGSWGARYGIKSALSLSLSGVACVTCAMGLLPTYAQAGEAAPLMLALLRLLQGFFGAGETTIAPFFVLQNQLSKKRGLTDSIYGSSTVMGELLASLAAVLVSTSNNPELYWRIPFWIGSLTAWVGIYLRLRIDHHYAPAAAKSETRSLLASIIQHRTNLLRVIAVSGMSYMTYSIPFVFFNSFIPQITAATYAQMMTLNTSLLALDMLIAPVFGWLSDKFSHAKFMAFMALMLGVFVLPLFFWLEGANLAFISAVRIFIVLVGLGFCAPIHAWFMTQFHGDEQYVLTGLGYSIGSAGFGISTPAICLLLWNTTQSPLAPALYVVFVSSLAFMALTVKR